jgi:hypothetical protein
MIGRSVITLHNLKAVLKFKCRRWATEWDPYLGTSVSIVLQKISLHTETFVSCGNECASEIVTLICVQRERPVFNRISSMLLRRS